MTDRDALYRAICADPDDDTPRLAFADWCDEAGQPERAAFVRAQIEATHAEPFSPQARDAESRAYSLLVVHFNEWAGGLADRSPEVRFRRGFVEHVAFQSGAFLRHADAVFEAEPVRSLRLTRYPNWQELGSLLPVFESPHLRRIRRLDFTGFPDFMVEEYAALAGCPHLAGLRELSLANTPVPPHWLAEFLTGTALPELTGLDLADAAHVGPCLAEALPRVGHRHFRRFHLSGVTSLNSDQLRHILASRCLKGVEELRLEWRGRPGEAGPLFHLDLGWVLPWERLAALDVSGHGVGLDGVLAITRTREAAGLRWLRLANSALSSEAVRTLTDAKHLNLNHLDVRRNGLTPGDLARLKARFPDAVIES
jgi:uncharacterized protein (TIGR02996 family)